MLTISPTALAFIRQQNAPVCVDPPPRAVGCCIRIRECPGVHLGSPRDPAGYLETTVEGITVFLPRGFPEESPLTIDLGRFLWKKRLALKGWRLI